jgi:ribosomal protein S18 acetylase RimI-like enzyme
MIIPATEQHIDSLMELDDECFPGWGDIPSRRKKHREIMLQIISQNYSFVAIDNEKIVGAILVHDQDFIIPDDRFIDDENCKFVYLLMVTEKFRHKGIGRELLTKVHQLHNHTVIRVRSNNEIAKKLYRSIGYRTILFTLRDLTLERRM